MMDVMEEVDRALNDKARIKAVNHLKQIVPSSTPVQKVLEDLAILLDVPLTAATFLDEERQHFFATNGGPALTTDRNTSYCQYVIGKGRFLCITDAGSHSLFKRLTRGLLDNKPLTSYLGFPLRFEGQVVGAVCAVDNRVREWTSDEQFEVYRASRVIADLLEAAKTVG